MHTASPTPTNCDLKDESEILKPAVGGTLAVMRGCRLHKVKRCVLTSSLAACIHTKESNLDTILEEKQWTDPNLGTDRIGIYERAKTVAERAAWDFIEEMPADERFELVTLLPGIV